MKKVLGFDLGVSSIGWALVQLDAQGSGKSIIDLGTRIIPLSTDEVDQFEKGVAQTKNRERTIARSARRNNFRYKQRRETLVNELRQLNMLPDAKWYSPKQKSDGTCSDLKIDLWKLRASAATEQISLSELGRVWLHLNQKRGYQSNRKSKAGENNEKDFYQKIDERIKLLNGRTIGQYFYDCLLADSRFRIKKNLFYRDTYIAEFDTIWNTQKKYYPEVLTDVLYQRLKAEIIYYQRKLKSQKHLVGGCEFENRTFIQNGQKKTEPIKVAPISCPLFQEVKIWQTINNIEIKALADKTVLHLEDEQRKILYDLISGREKTSWEQILKALGISKEDYRTNIRKDITGNFTKIEILKRLKAANIDEKKIAALTSYNPLLEIKEHNKQPYFLLWHTLYSIDDPKQAINALKSHFSFTEQQAEEIIQVEFKDGFSSLSSKALRKILPELRNGLKYHEACEQVGYRHSHHETKEEKAVKPLIHYSELKNIQRNELRNPAVERILNQLINLVKDIYANYGEPDEIRIELARELKQNIEERNNTFKRNKDREKDHDNIRKDLLNHEWFKGRRITMRDIEKYKLWREFDCRSPYQPNKEISLAELFSSSYEVEHIIPKARLFDDSFANKTIAHVSDNRDKDKDTAFDFMKYKRSSLFEQYLKFTQDFYKRKEGISKAKFERLKWSKEEIPSDFINRQLRETQYITRQARQILSQICRDVYVTSGSVTDYLRHIWGYDQIIHDLNLPLYKEHGLTEWVKVRKDHQEEQVEKIIGWHKRLDHRHHAVDALVIACTTQGMVHHLNQLNQLTEQSEVETKNEANKRQGRRFSEPFSHAEVSKKVAGILVSFKSGKKVAAISYQKRGKYRDKKLKHYIPRGPLHKESVYGLIKQFERIAVNKLTPDLLEKVCEPLKAEAITAHLAGYDNNYKKAFSAKEMKKLLYKKSPLTHVHVYADEYVLRYPLNDQFKRKDCEFIIDKRVRNAVIQRLEKFNDNSKEAFKELDKNPIYIDEKNGLVVNSVTCKTKSNNLQDAGRGFVDPQNNHHVAIYETADGELSEKVVNFWEAVERKMQGLPVIMKEDSEKNKLRVFMMQNEMFVFGLNHQKLQEYINERDYATISRYLYRVQKITNGDYWFRHHLETQLKYENNEVEKKSKEMKKFLRITSLKNLDGIKVTISRTGTITLFDD